MLYISGVLTFNKEICWNCRTCDALFPKIALWVSYRFFAGSFDLTQMVKQERYDSSSFFMGTSFTCVYI